MGKNHFLRAEKLGLEKIIDQRSIQLLSSQYKKGHSGRANIIIIIIITTTTTTTTITKLNRIII